jgi:hypothetical protein
MNFAIVYCPFLEATEYEAEVQGLFFFKKSIKELENHH